MTEADFLAKLSDFSKVEEVSEFYAELGKEADGGLALIQEYLTKCAANIDQLKEAKNRKSLKWVFLYVGLHNYRDCLPQLMNLVCAAGFGDSVPEADWLVCEISRLFGSISGDGDGDVIEALISGGTMSRGVREQLFMTQVFRWIAGKEDDNSFRGRIERLMANLPADLASPDLMMAIIVNAVAVGGNTLREQVMDFYKSHADVAGDMLTLKSVRNFFEVGKPRLKAMMVENYLGMYGKESDEINRALDFVEDERQATEKYRTTKPIVREDPKIGRNDPCPCGSGKKYKKCCGANK